MNSTGPDGARIWRVLACLGEPSRFRLVHALAEGEHCVGELAERIGLSQSCTTRHLQSLQREGLVHGQREGRRVRFRLRTDEPVVGELLGWALSSASPGAFLGGAHVHRGAAPALRQHAAPLPHAPDRAPSASFGALPPEWGAGAGATTASDPGASPAGNSRRYRERGVGVEAGTAPGGPSRPAAEESGDEGRNEESRGGQPEAARGMAPARPGDLEDYLL